MKTKIILCLTIFLLSAVSAGATQYTINDTVKFTDSGVIGGNLLAARGNSVREIEGFGDLVRWEHVYTFDPELVSIASANLTLSLQDDGGRCDWYEFAVGWTERDFLGWGEVDTGDYTFDLNLRGLGDGSYIVTLLGLGGDFFINASNLTIDYIGVDGAPAPVPEPATMLLLGIGLVGLAGTSRKKVFQKR